MLANAFQTWERAEKEGRGKSFCWDNFLSESTLRMLQVTGKKISASQPRCPEKVADVPPTIKIDNFISVKQGYSQIDLLSGMCATNKKFGKPLISSLYLTLSEHETTVCRAFVRNEVHRLQRRQSRLGQ
jgi:hypothetical protein